MGLGEERQIRRTFSPSLTQYILPTCLPHAYQRGSQPEAGPAGSHPASRTEAGPPVWGKKVVIIC